MSLERNRILIELTAQKRDDFAIINLLDILSHYSPVDQTTSLPVVPLHFDKDVLFNFILNALAKQLENGVKFFVLKSLSDVDEFLCKFGQDPPLVHKLVLQLLIHFSKIASNEFYNVAVELESDMAGICCDLLLPISELPCFDRMTSSSSMKILKFLTRPTTVSLFYDQLLRYQFSDLSIGKVKSLLDGMVLYETAQTRWYLAGWTVIDGIVLMLGALPPIQFKPSSHRANLYTLSLHESMHYLARCFSKNFAFSSPGKMNEFKDPDEKLANEGKGLELGRSVEMALLGVQVDWHKTPPDVARKFVEEVEDEHNNGQYLANVRDRLVPTQFPVPSSGMSFDAYHYYCQRCTRM